MADSKTEIQLVLQLVIEYLTLFHFFTRSFFFTNQEAQLCLLLVLRHVLLPHIFHTPKFSYGSHLYVGVIQIETFCLKSLKNGWRGRNTFFEFCDLNETLIFMSKFSMEGFLEIYYELVFQRKEGHIFSYHVPKSFKENLLLIFQSSGFKIDSNRKPPNFGLF